MRENQLSSVTRRDSNVTAENIWQAESAEHIAQARALFLEYAQWLNVDLCFQSFDAEVAGLPGDYTAPRGRLLLAGVNGHAVGCVALRPLDAAARSGEVKRMYVQPSQRGRRWGRRLGVALVAEARAIGYEELKLDTLAWMTPARTLYAELGFRECPPYYANPLPEVMYMSLQLSP
jgi:putative acetyltransferase